MTSCALVSFRLGGTDGVSIEAAKWAHALGILGHDVRTVAGEGRADVIVEGLAASAPDGPDEGALRDALVDCDLVIVENLVSLPLNLAARDALYRVLAGRPAILHHHDLAWQRPHLAHLAGPRDEPTWRHVTINEISRRELAERGIRAHTIYNHFDCSPSPGRRESTREMLSLEAGPLVVFPSRVIPRKNIAGALRLAERLDATLWIMGPVEDGYDGTFAELLGDSGARVLHGVPEAVTLADAYAASDLVVVPSTWEGFGNPVLESVTHRRPLALHPYPVAREIVAHGFEFFDLEDVAGLREELAHPDDRRVEHNLAVARAHFDLTDLPGKLLPLLEGLFDGVAR